VLPQVEKQANDAVYQNLPLRCWYPAEEELSTIPYRTKKALAWPVRIVEVPGYDLCACCGVHVAYTGQIGLVKLLSCVKFHEGVRIEMVCGARALDYLSRIYEQNKLVSQAFSAKPLETGAAAQRMNDALTAEKYRANTLAQQVFDHIAAAYADKGNVIHLAENLAPGQVRELADRIARKCGGTAAVLSGDDQAGYSVCIVDHARSVTELGKQINEALTGRGGGKPGFFQGSVKAPFVQVEHFFVKLNQFYIVEK
jgi:alanyl-tRNA synthetase